MQIDRSSFEFFARFCTFFSSNQLMGYEVCLQRLTTLIYDWIAAWFFMY